MTASDIDAINTITLDEIRRVATAAQNRMAVDLYTNGSQEHSMTKTAQTRPTALQVEQLEAQAAVLRAGLQAVAEERDMAQRELATVRLRNEDLSKDNMLLREDLHQTSTAFEHLRESIGMLYEGAAMRRDGLSAASDRRYQATFGRRGGEHHSMNLTPVDEARGQK